ncbi:MAG: response regulator [Proteobacteria bacterium]|nr:response regulator [Desulfobulbaceae bacterium]MBU4153370.1 response regulator [Pseudomonadota bacterium]MDP2106638.1 response regulator [Desulfobulbaceae bacterium]
MDPIKQTILVVEDHPATRRLLQDILGKEYQVITTGDGAKALPLINENPSIDLILLDIIMPGLNGYEVCESLKTSERTRDIPVIFLTVLEEDHDEARGFKAGVADYIIKPISRLRLLARIKNQLALRQKQKELEEKNRTLEAALEQIKTLHGILPICSFCKQIRNDHGAWQRLEVYIQKHSDAEFSHSVCPTCMKTHYPEFCPPK